MATIAIVAAGTRGDVQPYVALGRGLRRAGHSIRLLTSDGFEELVTGSGLDFRSTGPSAEERLQSDEWREAMERSNFLTILARMRAEMRGESAAMARRLPEQLAGSDLIVAGIAGLTSVLPLAEQLGVPFIQAHVFPFTPTRAFPSPLVPGLPQIGALNLLSFQATRQIFWQSFKQTDVALRRELGLARGRFLGPFRSLDRASAPILYGYSPLVLPRPDDWAGNIHVTGYWTLPAPDDWTPPADLADFLAAGDPPVYIGFGSMVNRDPQVTARLALAALARAGRRGVLAAGWGGLDATDLPPTVHLIRSVPHEWLFPRMAAVVHHGGAGTTAAGLRAGVPSVAVPFSADQPFWGRRVAALKVGAAPIPRKQLTAERLAQALTAVLDDPATRERADSLGRRLREEDGVGTAVALIGRAIGGTSAGPHARTARSG